MMTGDSLEALAMKGLGMDTLTDDERSALRVLCEFCGEFAYSFAAMPFLGRARARAACRGLAAKGLAVFVRGLMTEGGTVAGAGYAATARGRAIMRAVEAFDWGPFCECRQYPREPIWTDPRLAFV